MQEDPRRAKQRIDKLRRQGWAGDIMWQPYSEKGRPIECEFRAVSVVNFRDLVRLSNAPAKYVVCIAGLCVDCKESKQAAVVPLIRCAKTHRPFNHLVTTQSTAHGICEELEW
jgi:DNA-binding transcriptional regulator LsrR (DeoR family)